MILSCKTSFLDVFVAKISSIVKKIFNHFGLTSEEKKKEHYAGQGSIDKIFHDKRIFTDESLEGALSARSLLQYTCII